VKILKDTWAKIKAFVKREQALSEAYKKKVFGDPAPISLDSYRERKKSK
jgi:hypothetical protein